MRLKVTASLSGLMVMIASPAIASAPAEHGRIVTIDPVRLADGSTDGMVVRLSFPERSSARLPVVLFSHGNRLSRSDYQPVVQALAHAGYLVIQPDHDDASEDGFAPSTPQPADIWRSRVEQLRWIATHLSVIAREVGPLRGRIDPKRIAIVGHSFGGHSAALTMGASVIAPDTGKVERLNIAQIRGAILLAPPGGYEELVPQWKQRAPYLRVDWRSMRGPVLTVTGDVDVSAMSDQGAAWHEAPWHRSSPGGDKCLMRVAGGHYLGGIDGVWRAPAGDATPERRKKLLQAIVVFMGKIMGRSEDAARWAKLRSSLDCK